MKVVVMQCFLFLLDPRVTAWICSWIQDPAKHPEVRFLRSEWQEGLTVICKCSVQGGGKELFLFFECKVGETIPIVVRVHVLQNRGKAERVVFRLGSLLGHSNLVISWQNCIRISDNH